MPQRAPDCLDLLLGLLWYPRGALGPPGRGRGDRRVRPGEGSRSADQPQRDLNDHCNPPSENRVPLDQVASAKPRWGQCLHAAPAWPTVTLVPSASRQWNCPAASSESAPTLTGAMSRLLLLSSSYHVAPEPAVGNNPLTAKMSKCVAKRSRCGRSDLLSRPTMASCRPHSLASPSVQPLRSTSCLTRTAGPFPQTPD